MGKTIINFADANLFDANADLFDANERVVQQADLEEWSSMKMDVQIMSDNPLI